MFLVAIDYLIKLFNTMKVGAKQSKCKNSKVDEELEGWEVALGHDKFNREFRHAKRNLLVQLLMPKQQSQNFVLDLLGSTKNGLTVNIIRIIAIITIAYHHDDLLLFLMLLFFVFF